MLFFYWLFLSICCGVHHIQSWEICVSEYDQGAIDDVVHMDKEKSKKAVWVGLVRLGLVSAGS